MVLMIHSFNASRMMRPNMDWNFYDFHGLRITWKRSTIQMLILSMKSTKEAKQNLNPRMAKVTALTVIRTAILMNQIKWTKQ